MSHVRALSMAFGCVTLGSLEFLEHAQPIPNTILVPNSHAAAMLVLLVFLPALFLFALDRVILAARGEGALRYYRAGLLGLTLFFIGRQLHLYTDLAGSLTSVLTPGGVIGLAIGLALVGAAAWACYRYEKPATRFFEYMGAVSVVLVLLSFVSMTPNIVQPPETYGDTVTLETKTDEGPVFVLVFDELSYAVLTEDGELDGESFPNFARLADDGLWLTNATTSYYHTRYVVPSMKAGMEQLTDDYELWLYPQYSYVERQMWDGCGTEYTCRGATHRASENTSELYGYTAERWLHEALPEALADAASRPLDWLFGDLENPPPNTDPIGLQTFTKVHWEGFLGDISAEESPGRAYLFHSHLPHYPFVWDAEGKATGSSAHTDFEDDPDSEETYERYHEQTKFADRMLGEFLARLEEEGLYEDAVIIATGDHGLRRYDPVERDPIEIDPESVQVPMLIKAPSVTPAVSDIDYQHVDFGPTLLDVVGEPVEGWEPGVSVLAEERPEREKVFYIGEDDLVYWKFVYDEESADWVEVEEVEGRLTEIAEAAARPDTGLVAR